MTYRFSFEFKSLSMVVLLILCGSALNMYSLLNDSPIFFKFLFFIFLGVLLGGILFFVNIIKILQKYSPHLVIFTIIALLCVFSPILGLASKGSSRWINLYFFTLQPSELAKFVIIVYLANFIATKPEFNQNKWHILYPLTVIGIFFLLILSEPDLGSAATLGFMALGILYFGGGNLSFLTKIFVVLLAIGGAVMSVIPNRMNRFLAFTDPWSEENARQFTYQLTHSLMAISAGGWTGLGAGESIGKRFGLPEVHTDFVFAVFAEEYGLIGVSILLLVFMWLNWTVFKIGNKAMYMGRTFQGLFSYGIALWMGIQAWVHFAVNLGLIPTKGLPLPLFSFGGTSMVLLLLSLGIIFRIEYDHCQFQR